MAMAMESCGISRFTDISGEPVDHLLSPISGYQNEPSASLTGAIKPVSRFFEDITAHVFVALHNCQNPADGLTQDESASIHLYTMQFNSGLSLYKLLNKSLRAKNRDELKPWFSFLKLFLTALYKLPSQSKIVWRGVKNVDLSSKYTTGTKFAWWGVSSCTTHIQVLESNSFLGKDGLRTIFSIECINGKYIDNHSYFKNKENEIILMPGSYFEVVGQLNPAPDLYIIQLKEITPPITFVTAPITPPITAPITPPITENSPVLVKKPNRNWNQIGITIAGGNGKGNNLNQLNYPYGIFIDDDQTIYIADWWNHRIVEWKCNATNGRIVAGGNGCGNQTNQLNQPRDVIIDKKNNSFIISDSANRRVMRWSRRNNTKNGQIIIENIDCYGLTMDKDGSLYVSDNEKNEVRRWKIGDKEGTIIAGGHGQGNNLNQLSWPTSIFVDEDYSLYVSDRNNHRVMKWLKDSKEGIIVAGGNGQGKSLKQLFSPQGVIVDQSGQIYVLENGNHRVMRWCKGAKEGTVVVGGNGRGEQSNQFDGPIGFSLDRHENIYVADCLNHRIQKFEIN